MTIRLGNANDWSVSTLTHARGRTSRRRSGSVAVDEMNLGPFLSSRVIIESVHEATPGPARRGFAAAQIEFSVPVKATERCVIAVRHASGALTFHAPVASRQVKRRRGASSAENLEADFVITAGITPAGGVRRGLVSKAIKIAVLKIVGKIADIVVPQIVAAWERATWSKKGLLEGWIRVNDAALRSGKPESATPTALDTQNGRALLLLHGTFSNTAVAFRGLADQGFFERVAPIYGRAIYGFEHFSLSKTPEENARELIAGLREDGMTFDVITHSRGGLVLRNLVERSDVLGAGADRFKLGRALLVANPSKGTPLATPEAIEAPISWVANLMEMFPDNPMTTAVEWVAEAITWIGARIVSIPGLASMNARGEMIRDLNAFAPPAGVSYSALVADYEPNREVAIRLADLAVDAFFGGANDLVVPTLGGLQAGPAETENNVIPAERIGVFGDGGNLRSTIGPVNHFNFFKSPETASFATRAVLGESQDLSPIERGLKPLRRAAASEAFSATRALMPG
jgi:hypothetical protein